MKKIKSFKGYVIAVNKAGDEFQVFTKEEYAMGEGYRSPEFDGLGSIDEAMDNIDPNYRRVLAAMQEIEFVLFTLKNEDQLQAGETEQAHKKAQWIIKNHLLPIGGIANER